MACYVVLAPERIRGIHDTWGTCQAVVCGVRGAVYRKVVNRALAEQLLRGDGRRLEPGTYAFIDGNADGGIGAVLVYRRPDGSTKTKETATTVLDVFPNFASHDVARVRNPLAEIAAAYVALSTVVPGTAVTVVHDYEGTGPLVTGRWTAHDEAMRIAVARCQWGIHEGRLRVAFRHTNGHQSAVGGDEIAAYNARADALATAAVSRSAA